MVEKPLEYSHNVVHLRMPPPRLAARIEGESSVYGDVMTSETRDGFENLIQAVKAGFAAVTVVGVSWALGYLFLLQFGHLFVQ